MECLLGQNATWQQGTQTPYWEGAVLLAIILMEHAELTSRVRQIRGYDNGSISLGK